MFSYCIHCHKWRELNIGTYTCAECVSAWYEAHTVTRHRFV